MKKVCIRCVFGMYDAFLAAGSSNRDFYKALGVPDGKIFLMPLSVDNQFFAAECENHIRNAAATQRELGIESEFPTILYVGKMSARKRPADLLMAYANLVKSNVKANLVYVGDGVERKKLADYVSEFKLPRVFFLGFRNQSELPKFYAISHMFVIPSFDEPWGLVLNEAMCARLPVIATDRIGACEDLILNGDNGFLYECGDLESLTAKLKILVEDAELRARMGHRSFEIISKWSYEECVGGLMDALNYSLPGKVKKRLRQAF